MAPLNARAGVWVNPEQAQEGHQTPAGRDRTASSPGGAYPIVQAGVGAGACIAQEPHTETKEGK